MGVISGVVSGIVPGSVTGEDTKGKKEAGDVTQKNLKGFPDVAADILNVFIHGRKAVAEAGNPYPAPTDTKYAPPGNIEGRELYALHLLSLILQYTTAVNVLINVATIAGAMIPAGFTLPYWLR